MVRQAHHKFSDLPKVGGVSIFFLEEGLMSDGKGGKTGE
jgi:hypothetical protein